MFTTYMFNILGVYLILKSYFIIRDFSGEISSGSYTTKYMILFKLAGKYFYMTFC